MQDVFKNSHIGKGRYNFCVVLSNSTLFSLREIFLKFIIIQKLFTVWFKIIRIVEYFSVSINLISKEIEDNALGPVENLDRWRQKQRINIIHKKTQQGTRFMYIQFVEKVTLFASVVFSRKIFRYYKVNNNLRKLIKYMEEDILEILQKLLFFLSILF